MKSPKPVICLFFLVISAMYSCKKDLKAAAPALTIGGTYRITEIQTVNDDSTITVEQFSTCQKQNTEIFTVDGGYRAYSACSTDTVKGVWAESGNSLLIRNTEDEITDEGIVKNLTATGFVLDEHVTGFSPNILTFVKQ
jgi:hypothetical protein